MIKNKRHIYILIFIVLLLGGYFIYQSQHPKYIDGVNPKLSANSPKELIVKLLEQEEYFRGSIGYEFLNTNKDSIEIELINTSTGDDSIKGKNILIYAQKYGDQWETTSQKARFKCRGILSFWTTTACS